MTRKTMLGLLVVLAIGILTIPSYAASPGSPMEQFNSGIPIDMITCVDDKILMQSLSGKPICLTATSAVVLTDRGYAVVIPIMEDKIVPKMEQAGSMIKGDPTNTGEFVPNRELGEYPKTEIDITSDKFLKHKESFFMTTMESDEPNRHYRDLVVKDYPLVGESTEIIFTTIYNAYQRDDSIQMDFKEGDERNIMPYDDDFVHEPVTINAYSSNDVFELSEFELIIGTENPRIIKPYDLETFNEQPMLGETYTLKFVATPVKEGFSFIFARGFDHETINEGFAIGNNKTIPYHEYHQNGDTFIDHTIQLVGDIPIATPSNIDPMPSSESSNATNYDIDEDYLAGLAEEYVSMNWTDEQIMDDLIELSIDDDLKYSFLKDYLNFDDERIQSLGVR